MANNDKKENQVTDDGIKKLTADDLDSLNGGSLFREEKKIAGSKMKAPRPGNALL